MSSAIRVLSDHTINQIAAGEVIENPSSIVKELVENAIDAGASKVRIDISGGGLQKICISDDGIGMSPDDAVLCLERHATSKISQAEDLCSVITMGFRGEALASIASISKMTIQTCQEGGIGTEVEVAAGSIRHTKPCAKNKGTKIEVRQLFYNVPARRKFQKREALCALDILKVITQLSLANPMIGFAFYEDDKERLNLPRSGADFLEALKLRIELVLGKSFLEESSLIDVKCSPYSIKGVLGGVQNTRPTKLLQHAFINGRAVNCPILSYAVKDAFGTRIDYDRFPIYVLHLEIPSAHLDVNVHPQKKEVRLLDEHKIKQSLQEALQEELFSKETSFPPAPSVALPFDLFSPESFFSRPDSVDVPQPILRKEPLQEADQTPLFMEKRVIPIGVYDQFLWLEAASVENLLPDVGSDGVVLVDLKGASIRLLFESLQVEEASSQQTLLIPLPFECSLPEAEEISLRIEELEKVGFSLTRSGRQAFSVEAIPSLLTEAQAIEFLKIAFIEEKGECRIWDQEKQLARACSRIVSLRKESYSMLQALEVFYTVLKTKTPFFCPMGNKTVIQIGKHELQQMFTKKR